MVPPYLTVDDLTTTWYLYAFICFSLEISWSLGWQWCECEGMGNTYIALKTTFTHAWTTLVEPNKQHNWQKLLFTSSILMPVEMMSDMLGCCYFCNVELAVIFAPSSSLHYLPLLYTSNPHHYHVMCHLRENTCLCPCRCPLPHCS